MYGEIRIEVCTRFLMHFSESHPAINSVWVDSRSASFCSLNDNKFNSFIPGLQVALLVLEHIIGNFLNEILYGTLIVLFSTANKPHNSNITMIVWVALCRATQGLCFVMQFAVEIMSANRCTFAFCTIYIFSIGN